MSVYSKKEEEFIYPCFESSLEELVSKMELIRVVEERLLELFSEGKVFGTTHTCIGQEVCAVSVIGALNLQKDIVFSSHRCHGHFLMYSDNPTGLIAEIMGRQTGVCSGRGGSQHLCYRNFFSNGVQGGILPVATGTALAEKVRCSGVLTVCFLGDGTLGEGVVYEALNMASLWDVPILFVLEHNRYAQSTPTALTTAGSIEMRVKAFGIDCDRRAADDPQALGLHMAAVAARVRSGGRPFFQILDTYRLAAHSKGDDDRDPKEIENFRKHDPLSLLRKQIGKKRSDAIRKQVQFKVSEIIAQVEQEPFAIVDGDLEDELFRKVNASEISKSELRQNKGQSSELVVQNLNTTLHSLFEENESIFLVGEDVLDPYGGAFKVSRGLSSKFPERIITSPISEAGIVGLGCGMSMRGCRPILEIMFGDFLTLAADQIVNHLAKFHWMYNGQVNTPVVIRTPVGGGRGYGPTHSQCLEKMFLGIPGLVVVAISLRHNPGYLLRQAVLHDLRPVLFIEQKVLYPKKLHANPPDGFICKFHESEDHSLYPTWICSPVNGNAEMTIVTYGAMTEIVVEAMEKIFEEEELLIECVVPSQLAPLRIDPIQKSVQRTGRLLVVEEGTGPWGFGTQVVSSIVECFKDRFVPCGRVASCHLPIPNARSAEEQVLPNVMKVMEAIRNFAV